MKRGYGGCFVQMGRFSLGENGNSKLVQEENHHFLLFPKPHLELNPIERCWAFYNEKCTNSIITPRNLIKQSLASINKELMRKFFRKVGDYEKACCNGTGSLNVESFVKRRKSH